MSTPSSTSSTAATTAATTTSATTDTLVGGIATLNITGATSASSPTSTTTNTSSTSSPTVVKDDAKWQTRPLFGGALAIDLPSSFTDIAQFREIPDHQEVYANADTDQSVIVEINQYQTEAEDKKSGVYFFDDLASVNESVETKIDSSGLTTPSQLPGLPASTIGSFAYGWQRIAKHRDTADNANLVHIYLVNIRLPSVTSDVLIIVNVPTMIAAGSSSHAAHVPAAATSPATEQFLQRILQSFKINSYDVFGSS